MASGLFGSSGRPREREEESQPLPPPVQLGEIIGEELKEYDGTDPKKPLLMAIKGQIYDVSLSSLDSISNTFPIRKISIDKRDQYHWLMKEAKRLIKPFAF
ncbi:hypothetical protein SO802_004418 [Lithocarpus litseifolius]|uniref:Cytochrome b5 heme-binding domain-containing protein n=1 Tax=Lithocarpus litseifolius TaxID=425828 RepID=A0AAW2E6W3_9ROSI